MGKILEFDAKAISRPTPAPGLAPFRIEPRFVERVWGFRDLHPWFDCTATGSPIGEVWLTGDDCLIATGPHAGKRLAALFAESPELLLGPSAPATASPLLIKVLFAREKLSVQVHPCDETARKHGYPCGKSECWLTLDADPGAQVAVGLKPGTTLAQVESEIQSGTLESSLNMLPVAKNDMILVDAGTVHAIWPGAILFETQQNCDLTYRMYDYGRPRELHIAKSIEAVRMATRAGKIAPHHLLDRIVLIDEEHFRVERFTIDSGRTSESLRGANFRPGLSYLFAAGGSGRLKSWGFDPVALPAHGMVAVPAASPEFVLENAGVPGSVLDLIRVTPNWKK